MLKSDSTNMPSLRRSGKVDANCANFRQLNSCQFVKFASKDCLLSQIFFFAIPS